METEWKDKLILVWKGSEIHECKPSLQRSWKMYILKKSCSWVSSFFFFLNEKKLIFFHVAVWLSCLGFLHPVVSGIKSWLLLVLISSSCPSRGMVGEGPGACFAATCMGEPVGTLGSGLWAAAVLVVAAILRMSQQMEDFCLSISFSLCLWTKMIDSMSWSWWMVLQSTWRFCYLFSYDDFISCG